MKLPIIRRHVSTSVVPPLMAGRSTQMARQHLMTARQRLSFISHVRGQRIADWTSDVWADALGQRSQSRDMSRGTADAGDAR